MTAEFTVDLLAPAAQRWPLPPEQLFQARQLVEVYMADLGASPDLLHRIEGWARAVLPEDLLSEMGGLAEQVGVPLVQVLAGNHYYDAVKVRWGCTAFAVETDSGPIHARNLDWWTRDRLLNDATLITRFRNGPCGEFLTIGWPSFVGALSAVAPGRFAITLNAVLSADPPQRALPVVFLLRQVLEKAATFEEAVGLLSSTPIASDCLLLITGPKPSQMLVIERTPTRHAVREPRGGAIFVTNNYVALHSQSRFGALGLGETSCGRFDRIRELVSDNRPAQLEACLDFLADPDVQMSITVQQMAFDPRTGALALRIP